jgi:hypothetical protein
LKPCYVVSINGFKVERRGLQLMDVERSIKETVSITEGVEWFKKR